MRLQDIVQVNIEIDTVHLDAPVPPVPPPSQYYASFSGGGWFDFPSNISVSDYESWSVIVDFNPTSGNRILEGADYNLDFIYIGPDPAPQAGFYNYSSVKANFVPNIFTSGRILLEYRMSDSRLFESYLDGVFTSSSQLSETSDINFKSFKASTDPQFVGELYGIEIVKSGVTVMDITTQNGYFYDSVSDSNIFPSGTGTTFGEYPL